MTATIADVQLQPADYLAAQRLHRRKRGVKRALGVAFWIVYVALIIVFALAALHDSRWSTTFWILVVVGAFYLFERTVLLPRRSRRVFSQQRNLQTPFRIEFSEEGVACRNDTSTTNQPWAHYVKWKEDAGYFLFYYSDVMFQILPKRFLADSNTSDELRTLLTRRLGHAA